ncbi:UDP-3-O-(3-hydroxymyristoyl)glucosamine N-acyltransferase [Shewanella sp. SR43-8]|uniref:UDP-3-O-(3-hydroxymyristoyl)glucosamine N-acyltransferase n=1 Tax=Shewanella sp. SR43-8 TaxID=2760938 RepID=UPI0016009F7B|nr:UDP-3-O-(3-hydroxymyristoyl)glucosamine N-acyltransferase [Shewanella sp. SR43-8]MBB1322655.1 UDP-3-O-(3-hydroxymyristoyl)glucosamine N-acyltransferase [Shewanella sp. SR43-8]
MGYKLKRTISLSEIAKKTNLELKGFDITINGVGSFFEYEFSELSFTKDLKGLKLNTALVVDKEATLEHEDKVGYLLSENPRLDFIRILSLLESSIGFVTYDYPSEIHPSVKLGKNVVIEDGCHIEAGVIIEHNVVIHSGTRIGKNTRIRSCSSIGSDGFGFERLDDGIPIRFPHLGGVVIGENVEIGSCTTIACGTLSNTVIDNFVKVDNLVHIAHNCHIKKGAFIIACAELSGGVIVGENAWVAPNSCTHQKVTIGDNSLVGLGAVVTKNVPDNTVFAGNPAKKIRDL